MMRAVRRTLLILMSFIGVPWVAVAQTSPGLVLGQVPSATQWNGYFSSKMDWNGGNLVGTSLALGGATLGSFGLAVQADVNLLSNNIYFYQPPKIGWGTVSGCPAQGSANYEGMNICTTTVDNVLLLQNVNQAAFSAVEYAQYNGTWAAASGYGNPTSEAIFAGDFYQETNGIPWSVIAGDSCGRDLEVASAVDADPGAVRVFACSGSTGTAYGTKVFNIVRSSGNVYTLGGISGGNASAAGGPESGTKLDIYGSAAVGADATGGRYLSIFAPFNVVDPSALSTSMTKTGVVTVQWGLNGSNSLDTARALVLIDHDNSDATVMTAHMNGTRLTSFASLGSQNYSYATPTTGATVTVADTSDTAIIDPAGGLSTLTVNLPTCSALYDGKFAQFSSSQVVTTLTVGATAGTVGNAPTSLTAGGGARFMCRGANTTWYRVP
jgi:hypothetical protein